MPGSPVRLWASETVTTPAPLLGQHTAEVLTDVLGLSKDEIAELQQRRVVR